MKSKTSNIAEYILYLWELEDYLRAFPDKAEGNAELETILNMMRDEGIMEKGHLQIAVNALEELEDLHQIILRQELTYRQAFATLQPSLVLYKSMTANPTMSDMEACITFMYNVMLMRIRKKPLSASTSATLEEITGVLKYLSQTYLQNARTDDTQATL